MSRLCFIHFVVVSFLLQNMNFLGYINWGKAPSKMRNSEKSTFKWPKVSRLPTTLPRHRPDFRAGLRLSFRAPEVTVLKWGKTVKEAFSLSQNKNLKIVLKSGLLLGNMVRYALKKTIFCIFSQHGGGSSQIPKLLYAKFLYAKFILRCKNMFYKWGGSDILSISTFNHYSRILKVVAVILFFG